MAILETIAEKFFDGFWTLIRSWFKLKRRASEVFKDSIKIGDISKEIVETDLAIDCFFLMMAHNGSKKLIPHGFKYRSIIGGYYTKWLLPNFVITDYKNLELDYEYEDLLRRLKSDKVYGLRTKDMFESKLHYKFSYLNLKYVSFHFLHESEYGMWYIMAGTTQEDEDFSTAAHRQRTLLAVNKIKNIIKRY